MKTRHWFIAVLAVVASAALVRSLMGRQQISPGGKIKIVAQQTAPLGEMPPPDPLPFPDNVDPSIQFSGAMDGMTATALGGVVTVDAAANVYDTVSGNFYVWTIRINDFAPGLKVLREHHYTDRPESLAPGEVMRHLTFHDAFPVDLAAGTYFVEISLHAVGSDFDFKALKFGEDLLQKTAASLSASKKIIL